MPVALYNLRNTDDPKDLEYRVEDRITEHSEDIQLKLTTILNLSKANRVNSLIT